MKGLNVGLNSKYLCMVFIIFAVEVLIALFVKDNFIRGSVGDVLIVVLIYCFIKSFVKNEIRPLPLYIFIFAASAEIGQYFRLVNLLGLADNKIARIILGATFDIRDIACYLAGCIGIYFFERLSTLNKNIQKH